jgi:hypothetical protein
MRANCRYWPGQVNTQIANIRPACNASPATRIPHLAQAELSPYRPGAPFSLNISSSFAGPVHPLPTQPARFTGRALTLT